MKQAKDYIIFALDVPEPKAAREYIECLSGTVGLFKVGLELFINAGPDIISFIQSTGNAGVFLDLKLHDIPVTVKRAVDRIADLGVQFATVHCGENPAMLAEAVAGSRGRVGLLGVTVLTSVSAEDIRRAGYKDKWSGDLSGLVMKRAQGAKDAGCTGIICSGLEVERLKAALGPDFIAVTPGIRPAWEEVENADQQRVMTPALAVDKGADYLVIGRPIRDADDPRAAAIRIAEEINPVIS
jgi:orotidine-5'-phosphate decarboxylase